MMSQPRLVNRMGAGRWLLLLALLAGGLGLLRAQDAFAAGEGTVQFSASNYNVTEGGTALVTVQRTVANAGDLSVHISIVQTSPVTSYPLSARSTLPTSSPNLSFNNGCSLTCSKTIDGGGFGSGITINTDVVTQGTVVYTMTITSIDRTSAPVGTVTPGAQSSATLTVLDANGPPSFTFAQPTYTAPDVVGSTTITVNRTGGLGSSQSVTVSSGGGTAVASMDYTAISATPVNFGINEFTKTFSASILRNNLITGDRTFNLTLSGASNGGSVGPPAVFTITDTDGPGAYQFTAATFSGTEGSRALLQITRTGGSAGTSTLQCAVTGGNAITTAGAGQDIALPFNGTVTSVGFTGGQTAAACVVPLLADGTSESPETAVFTLTKTDGVGVIGAQNTTTLTINDIGGNGVVTFSSATYTVNENDGTAIIGVHRSNTIGGQTVQYATSDGSALAGTDYLAASGQVIFANGVADTSFAVSIIDNLVVNPTKTVNLSLSSPSSPGTLGSPSSAVLSVLDNEVGPPNVTAVTPNAGAPGGGNVVVVSGSGFVGVIGVVFKDNATSTSTPALAYFVVDPGTLNVTVPPGALGTIASVIVTTPQGPSLNTTADDYSYTNGPIVTAVTPNSGPANTATSTTITGQNFTSFTSVMFGTSTALNCTASAVTPSTTITCLTPATIGAGAVDVRVTTGTGISPISPSDQFTFTGAGGSIPTVTFLNPATGAAGAVAPGAIVITGTNFTAGSAVMFGSAPGTGVTFGSSTSLTVTPPARTLAGSVEVVVTTAAGSSATADTANDYTYTAAGMPTITTLAPTSTPINTAGTSVLITGTNFVAGASTVTFGGVAATVTVSTNTTSLTVTAPSSSTPGPVEVVVTTAVGSNTTVGTQNDFTYTGVIPTITSLTPSSGGAGTSVVINGTNFTGATSVTFGGVAATSFTVNDAQNITATVPSGVALGAVEVIVTTPSGANVTTGTQNDFTFGSGATATYQLFFVWNLIVYTGKNNYDVFDAIRGVETPANALTNDISAQVTAIFRWSPNGVGCTGGLPQCWLGWFPNGVGVPGANDFTTLQNGVAYWIAVKANVNWTILIGP